MPARYYPHGRGRWIIQLHWKGTRYRRSWYSLEKKIPLVHEELAKIICNAINEDIQRKGKYFDPLQWFSPHRSELNFKTYSTKWLNTQQYLSTYSDIKSYYSRLIIPFFAEHDLREIRKGHIKDFVRSLPEHYAPKTVKNILGLLHKLFKDALDDELILRVPPFPQVSVPETELVYISQEEVYATIDKIPERDQPIFRFGYFFALRPGEARALQWDQIQIHSQTIVIRRTFSGGILKQYTKSKRIRVLPLMTEPLSILDSVGRGIAGFVFRTRYQKPYRKQRLGELWRRASAEVSANFTIPLYNAMRHSRAMHLLEHEHWDLEYIRALLGHTRAEMTRRYARASAEGLRKRYGISRQTDADDRIKL